MIIKYYLPFFTPLITFGAFELLFFRPQWILGIIGSLVFIMIFSLSWLMPEGGWGKIRYQFLSFEYWGFLITPLVLILSGLFFSLFLEKVFSRHFLAFGVAVLLFFVFKSFSLYFYSPHKYELYSLENLISYVNLISFFLVCASLYSLIIFLKIILWPQTLLVLLVIFLLNLVTFWINKISLKRSWSHILIISLIITELFWVITFLPTGFYINATLLTVIYYMVFGLSRFYLLEQLESKIVRRYLGVGSVILIIIFITARWI